MITGSDDINVTGTNLVELPDFSLTQNNSF